MSENKNLPTIQDLYGDVEINEKENALNVLLNQPPKKEWLKDHPFAKREEKDDQGNKKKVPIKYIPVERVEWLLTRLFIKWKVEIKEVKLIANSVSVTVRLHYKSIVTGEWDWMDGTGAVPLQTDEGKGAIDFNFIKSAAVMIAAPAAESFAEKDAAEKIGKIFGRDMNRADQISYDSLSQTFNVEPDIKTMQKKIIDALDIYQGTDKEKIRKSCEDTIKAGKFDQLFAEIVAGKLGIKL